MKRIKDNDCAFMEDACYMIMFFAGSWRSHMFLPVNNIPILTTRKSAGERFSILFKAKRQSTHMLMNYTVAFGAI